MEALKKSTQEYCWEALQQLLTEKPYNKISVRDICRKVGISTVAFYNYFGCKSDLFYWHVHEDGKKYYSRLSDHYTWYHYLVEVLEHNTTIKDAALNLVQNTAGYESMLEVTFRCNVDLMTEYIQETAGETAIDDDLIIAMKVYLYGILHFLEKDIRTGMKTNRQDIAKQLVDCMPELLKRYIPH
jgi:AcrR family transcriptional regulator